MSKKKFIFTCIFLAIGYIKLMAAESTTTAFYAANKAYEQENYDEAIQEYQKIIDSGYESANLYYNLGNCYYKKGSYPYAILYYERAKRLNPHDPDLESNYEYVRSLTKVSYEPPKTGLILSWVQKVFSRWDINGLAVFIFIINTLIFLLLIVKLFFIAFKKYWLYLFVILGLILLAGVYDFTIRLNRVGKETVITLESVETKFEPQVSATTHFTIYGGEKIIVVTDKGDWVKVKRLDGKAGWVKKDVFEVI